METRLNIQQVQPNAFKALFGLENYLATTSLTKSQKELIKIRASQINGCAFCIDMHTKDALKKALANEPSVATITATKDKVKHPYSPK